MSSLDERLAMELGKAILRAVVAETQVEALRKELAEHAPSDEGVAADSTG